MQQKTVKSLREIGKEEAKSPILDRGKSLLKQQHLNTEMGGPCFLSPDYRKTEQKYNNRVLPNTPLSQLFSVYSWGNSHLRLLAGFCCHLPNHTYSNRLG